MASEQPTPWQPDRRWADPLISLLALLALLAAGYSLGIRQRQAQRPAERAGLHGRLVETTLAGPKILLGREVAEKDWAKARLQLKEPWDQALLAVLRAELVDHPDGPPTEPAWKDLPTTPATERFHQAWRAAYAGGPIPDARSRIDVHRRLGSGFVADRFEARLRDREGGGDALRTQALTALQMRLVGLGMLGLLMGCMALGGLVLGIYLLVTRHKAPPQALPAWGMSGRAAAIILLTWFLAFFLSGQIAHLLLLPWPAARWVAIPLGYLLHAAFGVSLICRAEGLRVMDLWHRVAPGRAGSDLAWGAAFLGLAVLLVVAVALVSNGLLKPDQNPQRDLQELLRSLSGWASTLSLFFTVAVLAPLFEELCFRGFLLPILARGRSIGVALVLSALLFGAIHLQPVGLPTLATLGFVMGLAMRHTGSLRAPVLMHACWNGTLFLLMRAFA